MELKPMDHSDLVNINIEEKSNNTSPSKNIGTFKFHLHNNKK